MIVGSVPDRLADGRRNSCVYGMDADELPPCLSASGHLVEGAGRAPGAARNLPLGDLDFRRDFTTFDGELVGGSRARAEKRVEDCREWAHRGRCGAAPGTALGHLRKATMLTSSERVPPRSECRHSRAPAFSSTSGWEGVADHADARRRIRRHGGPVPRRDRRPLTSIALDGEDWRAMVEPT